MAGISKMDLSSLAKEAAAIPTSKEKKQKAGKSDGTLAEAKVDADIFDDFRHKARGSKEPHRQQAYAVLEAVTDVISEKGARPTPTAYFASLMSALEQQSSDENFVYAVCSLLSTALEHVPGPVLRSKFKAISTVLIGVLDSAGESGPTSKAVLDCLATSLKAQDALTWSQPATIKVYQKLLEHAVDSRPKVRKRTHAFVHSVLESIRESGSSAALQTVSATTAQFCEHVAGTCSPKDPVATLHVLGLLKAVLALLSTSALGGLCELTAKLAYKGIPMVTMHCLLVVEALFESPDASFTPETMGRIITLIHDMAPSEKDAADKSRQASTVAYIKLVARAYSKLHDTDPKACRQRLPAAFEALVSRLGCEIEPVVLAIADGLKVLIKCIDEPMVVEYMRVASSIAPRSSPTALEKVVVQLESTLQFKYSSAWDVALTVLAALFKHMGRQGTPILHGVLKSIGDMYDSADFHYRDQVQAALGAAIAGLGPAAVLSVLPFELEQPNGEVKIEGSRVWLLPLLRDHVQYAELKVFATQIVPFAKRMQARSKAALEHGRAVEAKNLMLIYYQLWSLWPAFCTWPVDGEQFANAAKLVGTSLEREPDLFGVICTGMHTLITKMLEVRGDAPLKTKSSEADVSKPGSEAKSDQPAAPEALPSSPEGVSPVVITREQATKTLAAVGAFAPHFLPILFNTVANLPAEKRAIVHDTITVLVKVADPKVVNTHFKTIIKKLLETETSTDVPDGLTPEEAARQRRERQHMLTDLFLAFVGSLDKEAAHLLYRVIKPHLEDPDAALQKTAYKVLGQLCAANPLWFESHLADIREALISALPACATSAKKTRVRCVQRCIDALPASQAPDFIAAVLGEILLGCKEINGKARDAAFDVLLASANRMQGIQGAQGLREFLTMTVAGLAGAHPHMISATVIALSRLLFEFHRQVPDVVAELLGSVLTLLEHKSREIAAAAIGFVKVAVVAFPIDLTRSNLPQLVDRLCHWSADTKNHFRVKIRVIFERLIRKFGFDAVHDITPEDQKRMIVNIRKSKERANRKKAELTSKDREQGKAAKLHEAAASGKEERDVKNKKFARAATNLDSDSDDEDEDLVGDTDSGKAAGRKNAAPTVGQKRKTQIRESTDAEPLDLLSTRAAANIRSAESAARAQAKQNKGPKKKFPLSEDGKLVIKDDEDEDDEDGPFGGFKRKRRKGVDGLDSPAQRKRGRDDDDNDDYNEAAGKDDDDDAMDVDDSRGSGKKQKATSGKAVRITAKGKAGGGKVVTFGRANDRGQKKGNSALSGDQFRSTKGRGDVKKGKLQPFAYLPLSTRISVKQRSKAGKGVANMVQAAQKGSTEGFRSRSLLKKKRHKGKK